MQAVANSMSRFLVTVHLSSHMPLIQWHNDWKLRYVSYRNFGLTGSLVTWQHFTCKPMLGSVRSVVAASRMHVIHVCCPCTLFKYRSLSAINLDKISSRIFVTLRYRDEDPIVGKRGSVIIASYASGTIISNQRKNIQVLKYTNFINSYAEKSHFAKNMCKCIFDRIHEFTATLAAFKSKTGCVVQPITDVADATDRGFATRPLTSSRAAR